MALSDINTILEKVKKLEKGEKLDLSSDEDLSLAVMNLISIEEHLFFTAEKSGKSQYVTLLNEVRTMRKELMKKLIRDYEGEVWCISKHLLASSMRLMEVGTKMLGKGERQEAKKLFDSSYKLYSLFWGLNLGVIEREKLLKGNDVLTLLSDDDPPKKKEVSVFSKLGDLLNHILDCCKE